MMLTLAATLLALAHLGRAAEVCCGNTGCFNDNAPFNNFPLPTCASVFQPRYTMFTRTNRNNGQVFSDTVRPPAYVASRRTVFMAHGWNSDGTSAWLTTMKNAFLDREDINAVIVDWGGGAQILNYAQAASNTRTCGAYTALVFQNLLGVSGSSAARMWCVGHSLGSHVCGHTGMRMPSNQRLGRVTGMDPAGPLFEGNSNKLVGLNPTSATFVDVLHTSTDLGTLRDIGHVDFYPAGGVNMPGCRLKENENSQEAFENWESDPDDPENHNSCGHSRAYQYMIESIKSDCFRATQRCTNFNNIPGSCSACGGCGAFPCAFMGYAADSSCNRSGMYYLTATANVPYCTNVD